MRLAASPSSASASASPGRIVARAAGAAAPAAGHAGRALPRQPSGSRSRRRVDAAARRVVDDEERRARAAGGAARSPHRQRACRGWPRRGGRARRSSGRRRVHGVGAGAGSGQPDRPQPLRRVRGHGGRPCGVVRLGLVRRQREGARVASPGSRGRARRHRAPADVPRARDRAHPQALAREPPAGEEQPRRDGAERHRGFDLRACAPLWSQPPRGGGRHREARSRRSGAGLASHLPAPVDDRRRRRRRDVGGSPRARRVPLRRVEGWKRGSRPGAARVAARQERAAGRAGRRPGFGAVAAVPRGGGSALRERGPNPAVGDEPHPRRVLLQPHQPRAARGEGLHVRSALRLLAPARGGAVRGRRRDLRRAHGGGRAPAPRAGRSHPQRACVRGGAVRGEGERQARAPCPVRDGGRADGRDRGARRSRPAARRVRAAHRAHRRGDARRRAARGPQVAPVRTTCAS